MSFCKRIFPSGYSPEAKGLLAMAWPMVLTQLFQFSIGLIATIFCGHLGKIPLDAVALANTLINTTGISVAVGFAAACDTYFSQVYGSENRQQLGIYLQRGMCTITLAVFPCWTIHVNAEGLLLAFGQDPVVSRLAGRYMLIFMPGCLCFFIYISLSKYLQCQDIIFPNLIIGLVSNMLGAIAHYVFLYSLNMGTDGSAIAQVLAYFSMLMLTLAYIIYSKAYIGTWDGWSFHALLDWGEFFQLGIFGLLMVGIEWWSFEIGTFLTGLLGTTELAAQTVLFQLEMVAYMLPLGVGIAASIRVGQHLGNGDASAAKTSARVAITLIWMSGTTVAILLGSLRTFLPKIFTNVKDVAELASDLLPILAVYMIFDSSAGVCAGILRGSGRQNIGSLFVFLSYSVALAAGIPLMFLTSLRVAGFWIGLACALFIEAVIFVFLVFKTDWEKQVDSAQERTSIREGANDPYLKRSVERAAVDTSAGPQLADEHTALINSQDQDNYKSHSSIRNNKTEPLTAEEYRRLFTLRCGTGLLLLSLFAGGVIVRLLVPLPSIGNEDVTTVGYFENSTLYTSISEVTSLQ